MKLSILEPSGAEPDESPTKDMAPEGDVIFSVLLMNKWACTHGHDRCTSTMNGPWCPYCEPSGSVEIDFIEVLDYSGAGAFWEQEAGMLDYAITELIGVSDLQGDGIYVMEDFATTYHRGDGWETDDDVSYDHGDIRKLTIEELVGFHGGQFWCSEPGNRA